MLSNEATLMFEHPSWGEGKLLRIEGTDWIVWFERFSKSLRFPAEARGQLKIVHPKNTNSDSDPEHGVSPTASAIAWRPEQPYRAPAAENNGPPPVSAPNSSATSLDSVVEASEKAPYDSRAPAKPAAGASAPPVLTSKSASLAGSPEIDSRLARRAIESLSVGLPPVSEFARRLAINFQQTERLIENVLNDVDQEGGATVIIKGEYGQGKTFALRCLEEMSVESGYLVARTEIDATENRLNRPYSVYRDLIRHLRVPGEPDVGVDALIRRVMSVIESELPKASNADRFEWLEERIECRSLAWLFSDRDLPQKRLLVGMLAADPAVRTVEARYTHWSQIEPRIWPVFNSSTQGDFACYLLSGIGRLARMMNLRGLIIIMDEMEKWQEMHWREQLKASNFLGGLIWGATTAGRRHRRPTYSSGLEHSKACGGYPFTTKERNYVGIAIALTPRSEEEDPERVWCQYGGPILDVNLPQLNSARLIAYCERVAPIFADAFSTPKPLPHELNAIATDAISIWKSHGDLTMRSAVQSAIAAFHNWRDRREHLLDINAAGESRKTLNSLGTRIHTLHSNTAGAAESSATNVKQEVNSGQYQLGSINNETTGYDYRRAMDTRDTLSSSRQSHTAIRCSIAQTIGIPNSEDADVKSAVALACHPWPDAPLSEGAMNAISAELLPFRNINHPHILQIAIDRLLRLAEAVGFEGLPDLSKIYCDAAVLIERHLASDVKGDRELTNRLTHKFAPVAFPWGIIASQVTPTTEHSSRREDLVDSTSTFAVTDRWTPLIAELINASILQGYDDIGKLCGGENASVTVEQFANHFGVQLPIQAFDDYLLKMDTRSRDILLSRSYELASPETLTDVASRWKITRERVRQLELRAKKQLSGALRKPFLKFGYRTLLPFTTRFVTLEELYYAALAVARKSQFRDCLAGFVLELFGPWKTIGRWAYHEALEEHFVMLKQKLLESADAYGFIELDKIVPASGSLFRNKEDRDKFLTSELGLGLNFGVWTDKNSLKCKVIAAIKKIGRPATKEEVSDLLGQPSNNVASIFSNSPEILRADRFRWGFKEWIEDVYAGIVGEIEQRIEEYNGSVPLHILLRDIPVQFNVAEASVKAYIYSNAFVVEHDMVRLAKTEEYSPRSPRSVRDAVEINGRWGQKVCVLDRHFNGYSMGVNFDVAFANGLRPGDDLVVPIEGHNDEVSLIWRLHSINRRIDVGRIADFLQSQGYEAGDEVVIFPSQKSVQIIPVKPLIAESDHTPSNGYEKRNASGEDGFANLHDPLLDLLGD